MSTASSDPASGTMEPCNIDELDIFELTSSTTDDGYWRGGWFAYGGGNGAEASAVLYFSIPPGKRLGRHIDMTEETQYIVAGSGDLLLDEGARPVRPGDVVVLKQGVVHDLRSTGSEDLEAIAFFSGPVAEQVWTEEVWEPGDLTVTRSPNG
jgi:quercetin dioxygenase-like cupin family protein